MKEEPTDQVQPKIDDLDRMRIELRYEKMKNLKLQIDLIDLHKKEAGLQLMKLQEEMRVDTAEMSKKYGAALGEGTVLKADGTVVPSPRL